MKVSAIICTYNRPVYVKEAIDSVLNQTFRDFEVIVVNDGSTDNTKQVLEEYGDKIKILEQENRGINFSRNLAVKEAKGEYIALLDDDDIWREYRLDLQIQLMERYKEVPYLFSDFTIFRESGEKIYPGIQTWFKKPKLWSEIYSENFTFPYNYKSLNEVQVYKGNIYHEMLRNPLVLPTTSLIRKSSIPENIKFIEGDPMCGDWDFFSRLGRDNDVLFIDNDAALNRSHREIKRYTMSPPEVHLKSRLKMIDRVWKNDKDFRSRNHDEIDEIESGYKLLLAEHEILKSNYKEARHLLKDVKNSTLSFKYIVFKLAADLPFGRLILLSIRKLQEALFR